MKKTYRITAFKNFSKEFDVIRPGRKPERVMISFRPCGPSLSGCVYTTGDRDVQFGIERSKQFVSGVIKVYETFGENEEDAMKVEPVKSVDKEIAETSMPIVDPEVKSYARFKSVQAAANFLVNEYGADPDDVDSYDAVTGYAKKVGVSFPNLKE